MHAAYVLDAVTDNSERVGSSAVKVAVLASEIDEENRVTEFVGKLHGHVSLRAGSVDVSSACYNRVRALIILPCPQDQIRTEGNIMTQRLYTREKEIPITPFLTPKCIPMWIDECIFIYPRNH